jgi:origin recognition complex subunit 1
MPHSHHSSSAKAAKARRLLTRGCLQREDSDDELGEQDYPWQWVYHEQQLPAVDQDDNRDGHDEDSAATARLRIKPRRPTSVSYGQQIKGAKMGSFECKIGDCVLLKAEGEGNRAWVGLICEFGEDENSDMSVNVMCK